MDWNEMSPSDLLDEFRLAEPLLIRANFMLDHGGKGINLHGEPPNQRNSGDVINEIQKRRAPRLDKHHAAVFPQDAVHFRESLLEVCGQMGEVMQTALNDDDILASICKRELPAVGHEAFRRAFVLRDQARRKIHALQAREPEAMQRDQAAPAAAEKLDNFGVTRPLASAQPFEAADELANFFIRRFETQISSFPGIGCLDRSVWRRLSFAHLQIWFLCLCGDGVTIEDSHSQNVDSRNLLRSCYLKV